jgi:hypothetical protein
MKKDEVWMIAEIKFTLNGGNTRIRYDELERLKNVLEREAKKMKIKVMEWNYAR